MDRKMTQLSEALNSLLSHNKKYFNDKLILAGLFVLEWLLFQTYFIREISWGYPIGHDQTVYLSRYYSDCLELLNEGIFGYLIKPWVGGYSDVPTGILLQYEAALSSLIFGASRLNALFVNFINYVFLQILFYVSIKRIANNDTAFSLLCLGLLLAVGTPFLIFGGIFDFRLDFLAFCLFGSFAASVVTSNAFENRRWALVSGALGGLVILSRFNTVIYMALIYLILLSATILICLYKKYRSQSYQSEIIRTKNILLSASSIFIISCLPFVFSMKAIIAYYSVVNAKEGYSIWSIERGVTSVYDNIIYYLTVSFSQMKTVILVTASLSISFIIVFAKKVDCSSRVFSRLKNNFVFLVISFCIPLLILFSVKSSNQCVISIINVPFLFLLIFPLLIVYSGINDKAKSVCKVIFIIIFILSVLLQVNSYSKRGFHAKNRSDTLQVIDLYEKMGDLCQLYDINAPKILIDSVRQYFTPGILDGLFFEQHHSLLKARMLLAFDIFLEDKRAALKQVDECDFALLTYKSFPHERNYPVTNTINSIRDELNRLVIKTMLHVDSRVIEGRTVDLFMKPQLKIRGLSGGWITSDGLIIEVLPKHIKPGAVLLLGGSFNPNWLPYENLFVSAKVVKQGKTEKPLESKLAVEGSRYSIKVFLPEKNGLLGQEEPLRIKLSFSVYFIPSQLGINDDNRKLVLFAPSENHIRYE